MSLTEPWFRKEHHKIFSISRRSSEHCLEPDIGPTLSLNRVSNPVKYLTGTRAYRYKKKSPLPSEGQDGPLVQGKVSLPGVLSGVYRLVQRGKKEYLEP